MSRGHTLVRGTHSPFFVTASPPNISTINFEDIWADSFLVKKTRPFTAKSGKTLMKNIVLEKIPVESLTDDQINYYLSLASGRGTKSAKKVGVDKYTDGWGVDRKYWVEDSYGDKYSLREIVSDDYELAHLQQGYSIHTTWDGSAWNASILTVPDDSSPASWVSASDEHYGKAMTLAVIKLKYGNEVEDA